MIKGGKYINKTQDHSAGTEQPGGGTQSAMNKKEGLSLLSLRRHITRYHPVVQKHF